MVIFLGIALLTLGWLWYEGAYNTIFLDPVNLSLGVIGSGFSVLASPFTIFLEFILNYVLLPLIVLAFILLFFAVQFYLVKFYIWVGENLYKFYPLMSEFLGYHLFNDEKSSKVKKEVKENPNTN